MSSLEWLAAAVATATSTPVAPGSEAGWADSISKLIDSIAGLVTAFGSLAGLLAAIGAVIAMRRSTGPNASHRSRRGHGNSGPPGSLGP